MRVYRVYAEIETYISAKRVTRKGEVLIGANSPQDITLADINKPENLHKLIPRFITGKLRSMYKASKIISIDGPFGLVK